MSEQHLTIGGVASLSGLTVKALRHYDDLGLLRPDYVDPRTGYRQYSTDQLRTAVSIAALRAVDMPLSEIAVALTSRDARRQQLEAHRVRLIGERADIDGRLAQIVQLQESLMTDVQIHAFPETPIYRVAVAADGDAVAWPSLPPGGALLTWAEVDGDERVVLHFAVERPDTPNDVLAAFEGAVATTDDHTQIPATVSAILDWIADHSRRMARPPVERILPSSPTTATIELWVPLAAPGELGRTDHDVRPIPVEMPVEAEINAIPRKHSP